MKKFNNLSKKFGLAAALIGAGMLVVNGLAEGNYATFSMYDSVYYDPVAGAACRESDSWTVFNTDTTCYRFFVLTKTDTNNDATLKLLLDHNVATSTFDEYPTALATATKNWSGHNGVITIIDEDTIADFMLLGETRPSVTTTTGDDGSEIIDDSNISVNGGVTYSRFRANSLWYFNGEQINEIGFWSSTEYADDTDYVYTITEYGNNRLVKKTQTRGVRPVIEVSKDKLEKTGANTDNISDVLSLAYAFPEVSVESKDYGDTTGDGVSCYTYRQLQGFALSADTLLLYASDNSCAEWGVTLGYDRSGNSISSALAQTGHGNGATYNSATNQYALVGANDYHDIYFYDADTFEQVDVKNVYDNTELIYTGIAYDAADNYYFGAHSKRIYVLDPDTFEPLYSFDAISEQTMQDIAYHNGYVYFTTFSGSDSGCPSTYQIYCEYDAWTGVTYVYNVHFDEDGTPSENFGRLVNILYTGAGVGELESMDFEGEIAFMAFAAQHYDTTSVFKILSTAAENVTPKLNYNVSYVAMSDLTFSVTTASSTTTGGADALVAIVVTADEDFDQAVMESYGFIKSNARTYVKFLKESDEDFTAKICDRYANCDSRTFVVAEILDELGLTTKLTSTTTDNDGGALNAPDTGIFAGEGWSATVIGVPVVLILGIGVGLVPIVTISLQVYHKRKVTLKR